MTADFSMSVRSGGLFNAVSVTCDPFLDYPGGTCGIVGNQLAHGFCPDPVSLVRLGKRTQPWFGQDTHSVDRRGGGLVASFRRREFHLGSRSGDRAVAHPNAAKQRKNAAEQ